MGYIMFSKYVFVLVVLGSFIFFQGCVKEDFTRLSDEYDWQPNFSLPLSTLAINSGDYVGSLSFLDNYNATKEILISKTVDFDFAGTFSENEYVEKLMFRFSIKNKFPARLEVYAYYLDNNLQIVKSVIAEAPIHIYAPYVDDEGSVTQESHVIHDEYFTDDGVSLLENVKYVFIQVFIKDLDQRAVVINQIDNYTVDLGLGIRAYLNIPINE